MKKTLRNIISGDIADAVSRRCVIPNKSQILSYLADGETVACASGYARDIFTGQNIGMFGDRTFSDGVWCWTTEDIYHFEKYDAALDPEFVKTFS